MFLDKSSLEIVKDEFSAVGKFCIYSSSKLQGPISDSLKSYSHKTT